MSWIPGDRSNARRNGLFLVLLAFMVAGATGASALSIVGSSTGPGTAGSSNTVSLSFDAATSANGYDVYYVWDPTELTVTGASNLFFMSGIFPLTIDNQNVASIGSNTVGRAANIGVTPFTTTGLVEIQFDLLTDATRPLAHLFTFAFQLAGLPTGGLSPGGLVVGNDPADLLGANVPEPSVLLLAGLGLGMIALSRRTA